MADCKVTSESKCFDGYQRTYVHRSSSLQCDMNFGLYLPPGYSDSGPNNKFPILFYLSGLTCTEANFVQKSGFQKYAAQHGLIVVNPDTSPRGCNIEGEDDSWDFGSGAGFYVDATEPKWASHYRMYTYVTKELPLLITNLLKNVDPFKFGIFGHSMGGHGALICALKHPDLFKSVSCFAPICNPANASVGRKAFAGYLGLDESKWSQYDACHLVKTYQGPNLHIIIDQGTQDEFYVEKGLLTENLIEACSKSSKVKCDVRFRQGYDHGYFFVSTFIGKHFEFHAKNLK